MYKGKVFVADKICFPNFFGIFIAKIVFLVFFLIKITTFFDFDHSRAQNFFFLIFFFCC